MIALRLAYAIKNDKSQYYKAFDLCNDVKNRGDVTPFILMFLEMLEHADASIFTRLDEGGANKTKETIKEILIWRRLK